LAVVFHEQGNAEEAMRHIEKAFKLDPTLREEYGELFRKSKKN
jgi:hypothetical protein